MTKLDEMSEIKRTLSIENCLPGDYDSRFGQKKKRVRNETKRDESGFERPSTPTTPLVRFNNQFHSQGCRLVAQLIRGGWIYQAASGGVYSFLVLYGGYNIYYRVRVNS